MAVAGGAVFGLLSGGVWLVNPAVVLPDGGGLGESTIPLTGCAVEGVGNVLIGTEFVTGAVETVGETLFGLPSTLFGGCGMLGGVEGALLAGGAIAVDVAGVACGVPGSGSSGSISVTS